MGGCGHGGYVSLLILAACARKSNSRETHFRVVLVYKLLVTMSLLELGPVIFGSTEAIISYFRAQTSCHKLHLHYYNFVIIINHDM